MFFVSEYGAYRGYGGPEEGGWWYDWNDYRKVVARYHDKHEAYERARRLNSEAREDRYSVLSVGADPVYFVEEVPGEHQTKETPRYC